MQGVVLTWNEVQHGKLSWPVQRWLTWHEAHLCLILSQSRKCRPHIHCMAMIEPQCVEDVVGSSIVWRGCTGDGADAAVLHTLFTDGFLWCVVGSRMDQAPANVNYQGKLCCWSNTGYCHRLGQLPQHLLTSQQSHHSTKGTGSCRQAQKAATQHLCHGCVAFPWRLHDQLCHRKAVCAEKDDSRIQQVWQCPPPAGGVAGDCMTSLTISWRATPLPRADSHTRSPKRNMELPLLLPPTGRQLDAKGGPKHISM